MFGRILLKNDVVEVSLGLFGGLRVYNKLRKYTIKARSDEKQYLFELLDEIENRKLFKIEPSDQDYNILMNEFANAVCSRNTANWTVFFGLFPPPIFIDMIQVEINNRKNKL